MKATIALKALASWVLVLIVAIINGVLREEMFVPALGASGGLIASGVILSCCVFLVAFIAAPWYGRLTSLQYWRIGLVWLLLTLFFEFGFGRFVQHKDWAELFQAYTFSGGNLWPIVLVATLVAPRLAAKLRDRA
ncbi:MAG: hypothetical protein IH605_06645 [Burkholderiales bacterium]|nr:hypothetical protein [Burkholderiales bacterium]